MHLGRIILIVIVIFVLGLIVLPSTVNIFAGSHTFYNVSEGSGSNCEKCHADVLDELEISKVHATVDNESGVSGDECRVCHRANVSASKETHPATVTSCRYCHLNLSNITGAPLAGGFGLTGYENDTGSRAMHASYVHHSGKSDLLPNTTEACVGCHSNTWLNVSLNVSTGAKFDVYTNHSKSFWNTSMEMSNFTTHEVVVD